MEYYSAIKRNAFESVLKRWMKLEHIHREVSIIHREVRKRNTNTYINTYLWNLERMQQRSYMQGSKRDTDVKNRLLDYVGEGEAGVI